jgi:hypothetical protein
MATYNPLGLAAPKTTNMSVTPTAVATSTSGGTVYNNGVTTYTSGRGASVANYSSNTGSAVSVPPPVSAPVSSGTASFGVGGSGWQNVADTFKLIEMQTINAFGGTYDLSPKGSPGWTPDWFTKTATSPSFVFGAPAVAAVAYPLISSTALFGASTGTGATAATIGSGTVTKLFTPWGLIGAGAVGGALLFGDKGGNNAAPQTQKVNPDQITTPNQSIPVITSQKPDASGASSGYISGGTGSINNQRYVYTYSYPYIAADQTTSPYQAASAQATQDQTSGTNWLLLAAVAAGAFILARK